QRAAYGEQHDGAGLSSAAEAELPQLFAQRATIDAENDGCPALIALRIVEHHAEQRLFDLTQYEIVQLRRTVAVQACEVVAQRALGMTAQRQLATVGSGSSA